MTKAKYYDPLDTVIPQLEGLTEVTNGLKTIRDVEITAVNSETELPFITVVEQRKSPGLRADGEIKSVNSTVRIMLYIEPNYNYMQNAKDIQNILLDTGYELIDSKGRRGTQKYNIVEYTYQGHIIL